MSPPAATSENCQPEGRDRSPHYLVGSSKNMTGGLLTSSSAMARRLRWPPERLPVRVLAHDSRPRAVRISLTWGDGAGPGWSQGPPGTPHTYTPSRLPPHLTHIPMDVHIGAHPSLLNAKRAGEFPSPRS